MISKSSSKSARCTGSSLSSARCRPPRLRRRYFAHSQNAAFLEKHVLGPAKSHALGAETPSLARVARCVGVCANFHAADAVRPFHDGWKRPRELGGKHFRLPASTHPVLPWIVMMSPDLKVRMPARITPVLAWILSVPGQKCTAGPCHAPRPPRDLSCRRAPSVADRRMHALVILGARFGADENDVSSFGLKCLRHLGMKCDLARRGSRRGGQSLGDQIMPAAGSITGCIS